MQGDKAGAPIHLQLRSEQVEKKDVFDSDSFDAVQFINKIYPDESSLTDLDRFVGVLKRQIRTIDKEIFTAVRAQGGAHTRARDEVVQAHQQIEELFSKIKDIQLKAEESENMVQEICRDIKKLDYAKKHLTFTITALRRLAMLTAAITDLELVSAQRDQYKKCANLLGAVHQLIDYFMQYESVPKVKNLTRRLDVVQAGLQSAVLDDFKILMGTADVKLSPENLDRLATACLVVDALGAKIRDQLMDWFCDREMNIYTSIFSMSAGAETSKLDRFERRFAWFRSRLEEKKDQWAIFPENWEVPRTLCLTFCNITKAHLKQILSNDEGEIQANIVPMIATVAATNKFEKDMATLFGGKAGGMDAEAEELASENAAAGGSSDADGLSASEARKRLEKVRRKERLEAHKRAMDNLTDKERQAAREAKTTFEGIITDAFEGVLRFYVLEEEKELSSHLEAVLKEEYDNRWSRTEEEGEASGPRVLPSANKLFFKIRASLTRCGRMISKGQTLLSLTLVFKNLLSTYAAALVHRLPKTALGLTNVSPPYNGQDWFIKMSEEEERVVCHILQTAEFCKETIEGLSSAIRKDIKPSLADKVDYDDLEGSFLDVASRCLGVLVLGINTNLDPGLHEMHKIRWDAIEQPGDDSTFVNIIRKVLMDTAPRIGRELDSTNFSFLCDKMARMFVPSYQDHFARLKKVSEKGTLQLSIDCDSVKRALLDFPKVARIEHSEMPGYDAYVEREMGSIINTVKVLQSKPENLVDTFLLLMPAQSQTVAHFGHVCEMKVLSKKQQTDLMALYQHKMAGGDEASAPSIAPSIAVAAATAATLGAFNFTQLTSQLTTAFPGSTKTKGGANAPLTLGAQGYQEALLSRVSGQPVQQSGQGTKVSGFTDAVSRGVNKLFG